MDAIYGLSAFVLFASAGIALGMLVSCVDDFIADRRAARK